MSLPCNLESYKGHYHDLETHEHLSRVLSDSNNCLDSSTCDLYSYVGRQPPFGGKNWTW